MIPARLVMALRAEIADAVKDYKMEAENQEDKKVTVYAQHIPDEDFEDDTYYPLIIVSLQKVKDEEQTPARPDSSTATVGLTFGVHGFGKDTWRDLLNLMEHVRQRLLRKRTIADLYRLSLPLEWEAIEAQPYPFWFGYGTATYTVAQPQDGCMEGWQEITEEYAK